MLADPALPMRWRFTGYYFTQEVLSLFSLLVVSSWGHNVFSNSRVPF